ncbi:hypothetical protein CIK06_23465 [Plantactinospora sp. KBS50]|nr:hypothetical protein CIK06_23465 [Plantactinospora sp. KBS50]
MTWLAERLSLWTTDLLGSVVLWFLLVGFVWFINLGDANKDPDFFKRRFFETLGLTALLEFFINAQVMPLPLELVAQVILLIVVILNVIAASDEKYKPAAKLTSGILFFATMGLLTYSVAHLVSGWDSLDKRGLLNELLMPIWLTAATIPVLYLFAFYMAYESLFVRLSFFNNRRKPSLRARLGIVTGIRGALVDIQQFRGGPAHDAAQARTTSDARAAVRRFKEERALDRAARAAARQALVDNAGRKGTDGDGLLLDRREFAETKDALRWLATCHMGWYRNADRPDEYRADLLDVLSGSRQFEFESGEPVVAKVRKDRQAWYAYRRTPSGHVFGIGASGPPPSQWFYDAPTLPSGYPSTTSIGWTDFMSPDRPEWRLEPER